MLDALNHLFKKKKKRTEERKKENVTELVIKYQHWLGFLNGRLGELK